MKKTIPVIISILALTAITADASWMGLTWLLVRAEKVLPGREGSDTRKADLNIMRWARGAGHGDSYGKDFPGKTMTVELSFPDSRTASGLRPGQTFWVEHQAATWLAHDSETGKRIAGSSSRWKYLGDTAGPLQPLEKTGTCPESPEVSLLWSFQQNSIISMKVQYRTFKKYGPQFRLYRDDGKSDQNGNTVSIRIAYSMTEYSGSSYVNGNQRETDEYFLQFSAKDFSGKEVIILSAGKKLASFNL